MRAFKKIVFAVSAITVMMAVPTMADTWVWADVNGDGISQCYLYDDEGGIYTDCVTPDGFTVDATGAWTEDGVVQTQSAGVQVVTGGGYNAWGVSNAAIDMIDNTREENAKYGEVMVVEKEYATMDSTGVYYANGLYMTYVTYHSGSPETRYILGEDVDRSYHDERLFAYFDENLSTNEIISLLESLGYTDAQDNSDNFGAGYYNIMTGGDIEIFTGNGHEIQWVFGIFSGAGLTMK